jgi:ATP-dependent exoDNAse (exonuclease V) alpha subunit
LLNHQQSAAHLPDVLGTLADNHTVSQEQDWAHEYHQRKQNWKLNIICEQQRQLEVETTERELHYHPAAGIISNLSMARSQEKSSTQINTLQSNRQQQKSNSESVTNMQTVLSAFSLNELQTAAYEQIARHSFTEKSYQLRMFMAGPGGTGKSWVVDAVRDFFRIQNQEYRLRLASYTGVASRHIHGMTLHSSRSLNKVNKRSTKGKLDLIAMWRNVDYLIIDEVSMIGCRLMLQIHEALCEAKENTELFGGINVIFVGDFAQLPPVGDTRLYSHLETENVGTTKGQRNVFGKLLWLSIDKVIILKELMRQNEQQDLQFTQLLARLRIGCCTDSDYQFLMQRELSHKPTNFSDAVWRHAPIIVSNNDVKDSLNLECAKSFAARTTQSLHFYYATDKRKGKQVTDPDLQQKLWSYHSGKTDQRAGVLPLCKDMPVMITQNYDVGNGIVNGCIGTLQKVNYAVDDKGLRHAQSCIIRTEEVSGPCLPHLKEHEVVVTIDDTPLTFTHPHSHVRSSFQRSQLAILPAFALTAHKSQGNTLPSAILDLESCLSTEAVYVMLSRVKKSENIRILRPFRKAKISTRISEDLRKELNRLEFLHTVTTNPSMSRTPLVSALGGVQDLQKIETWFNENLQTS